MIAAILRAQWLSMRPFRAGSGRRGAVFAIIVGLFWYSLWTAAAIGIFAYVSEASLYQLSMALPFLFLGIFAYWQIAPALTASLGAGLDLRKLLVYPVPHGRLFVIEVLLRFTTAGEMLLIVAGTVAGLAINPHVGGIAAWPRIAVAAGLFVGFNVLLGSGLRSLLERLLSRRRVREVVMLLLVIVLALPRVFLASGVRARSFSRYVSDISSPVWPWADVSLLAVGRVELGALALLAAWTIAAGLFGRWQFERNLRYDSVAAQATPEGPASGRGSLVERFYRLPAAFLPDPLAAIVEKELRSLSRTPRFRMVFIMGFTFGILIWLPMITGRRASQHSTLAQNFLVIVSLYALTLLGQVSYWNAFGFDRSAAQVWFSLPVNLSRAIAGKNIAALLFIYLEVIAVTLATLVFRIKLPPARIAETLVVTAVAALYMLAIGNLSSVHYPRGMNPERVSQGGAANRFQALIFILYPLALLPLFLAYLARYAFASETVFYLIVAVAAGIGGVVYWIAMQSAVDAALRRREVLLNELARGEGPVAGE